MNKPKICSLSLLALTMLLFLTPETTHTNWYRSYDPYYDPVAGYHYFYRPRSRYYRNRYYRRRPVRRAYYYTSPSVEYPYPSRTYPYNYSAGEGFVGGALTGAAIGGLAGGRRGAGIGAAVGGITGLATGAAQGTYAEPYYDNYNSSDNYTNYQNDVLNRTAK